MRGPRCDRGEVVDALVMEGSGVEMDEEEEEVVLSTRIICLREVTLEDVRLLDWGSSMRWRRRS